MSLLMFDVGRWWLQKPLEAETDSDYYTSPPRTKKQWEINGGIQVSGLTCEEPAMKHDETMTSIVLEEKKNETWDV